MTSVKLTETETTIAVQEIRFSNLLYTYCMLLKGKDYDQCQV